MSKGILSSVLIIAVAVFIGQFIANRIVLAGPVAETEQGVKKAASTVEEYLDQWVG